jgi:hypothetical protein
MPFEFSPKVPAENSPLRYVSIASKATRRRDVGEDVKIEIDDRLESLGGGAAAKIIGQGVAPGGVFGLQGEQFGDGVVPSLWSGASVGRSAIAYQPKSGSCPLVGRLNLCVLQPLRAGSGRCETPWRVEVAPLQVAFQRFTQDAIPPLDRIQLLRSLA